jgi:hypothetical protein
MWTYEMGGKDRKFYSFVLYLYKSIFFTEKTQNILHNMYGSSNEYYGNRLRSFLQE